MSRDFNRPRQVFCARQLIRKHEREQIFRGHALKLGRNLAAAAPARDRQRARRIPTPANREHWRVKQCLRQHVANRFGIQIIENRLERETMRWPKRKHDRIFGRGSLQLKIKAATKALAQGESPGSIQATAERRVNYDMCAAVLIKESLDDDLLLSGHHAESNLG